MDDIGMIRKIAWSFYNTTRINWDDLFQEAALAYIIAKQKYKRGRGKRASFFWNSMLHHLIMYTRKELEQQRGISIDDISAEDLPTQEQLHVIDDLSPDAMLIADAVLRTPKVYAVMTHDDACKRVHDILLANGVPEHQIINGLRDIHSSYK